MSAPLYAQGAIAVAHAVRSRTASAGAVLDSVIQRLESIGTRLNAYRATTIERARREAAAVDAAVRAGRDPGPLAGVPYGVKDLFDVAGLPTVAGSKIGLTTLPAARDATLVTRIRQAGGVLLGVQLMDEYAYGFTTENAHYGNVRNPHDMARSAGGSSGGSAAAVAAGLGAFSLASDTNGSIRVPASFCGLYGLKPTFGRLPRTGTFPFVHDLDHLGPLARSAEDLALVYDVLQGADTADPGCAVRPVEPVLSTLHELSEPPRAGVLGGWFEDMAGDDALAAVAIVAQALGAREKVELAGAERVRSAAYIITAASGANLHRENLRSRPQDFDPATRGRLLAGGLLPAGAMLQAQRLRRSVYDEALRLFARCDLLLAAATPVSAPLLGQATITINGRELPARPNIGLLTQPLSALGLPIVVVPINRPGKPPIGVQIVAAPWREDLVLRAAAQLEAVGVAHSSVVDPCI